jgi:7-cyano-7-deazaguanine synthase
MLKKSIVLLSGGMDSLLVLAKFIERGDDVYALHFDYGQRTLKKESLCFDQICDFYELSPIKRKIFAINHLKDIGGSSLTDNSIQLSSTGENLTKNFIPNSYVPFRNTIMLSMATSWAEVIGATSIGIGAVEDDSNGYPDCRPVFYDAFNKVIEVGTKEQNIRVETPVIDLTKVKIINQLVESNAPLQFTWSCYKDDHTPCKTCDSCRLRAQGFFEAKKEDPIFKL